MAEGRSRAKVIGKFVDSIMVKLSDDIFNIFLNLSVKSILRCKTVCKVWRQLLCDPAFVRLMHINKHHPSISRETSVQKFLKFFLLLKTTAKKLMVKQFFENFH